MARLCVARRLGAFEDRQADVDRVAEKDARKGLGHHAGDAGGFEG